MKNAKMKHGQRTNAFPCPVRVFVSFSVLPFAMTLMNSDDSDDDDDDDDDDEYTNTTSVSISLYSYTLPRSSSFSSPSLSHYTLSS